MKRFLSVLLILSIILCFAACVSCTKADVEAYTEKTQAAVSTAESAGETTSEQELYNINVFTMLGNYSGIQSGWFGKIIRDKFNIRMNLIASNIDGGEAKFSTLLASGNLGDIVIFGNNDSKYLDSISGGFLLDMDKDGLLDNYGQEIVTNYPKVLEKARINSGGGTAVYGLGYNAANMPGGPSEGEEMTWGPDLRWDLYARLGYPEINTMEDYLPVLKQMQQLEPRSESGWPTYGFSLWSDWDNDKMCLAKQYCNVYGYEETDGFNPYGYALISAKADKCQSLLDPEGYYIKCLRLYFNANQMGLLDPDSISQKYEDVTNKIKDGQVLFSWFPWMDNIYNTQERQAQGKGFRLVPFTEEKVYSSGYNPYGGDRIISIGASATNPERLMQLINWMYSPEGFQTIEAGPRGLTWDIGGNGRPYLTEYGLKALPNNPEPVPAEFGGGTYKDGQSQMNIDPIQMTSINPQTGEAYDFHLWTSYLSSSPSRLVTEWREKMGALTAREYFEKNGLIAVSEAVFTGKAPENMSKTLERKKGQVSTVIRNYSWRMVFAKDQAEFDSLCHEMVVKAKNLGYNEIFKWNADQALKIARWRENNG
ncbi:MAG TPA: ABC transporter substrate-binding protein [Clostridia bacterium]|nr:ABC transporter substrate-binding protein [Clostridia bacterium]